MRPVAVSIEAGVAPGAAGSGFAARRCSRGVGTAIQTAAASAYTVHEGIRKARRNRYEGTLSFDGRTFPITAREEKKTLSGEFQDGKGTFPFTATIQAGKLRFNSGGVTHVLDRDDPVNPLVPSAAPVTPANAESGLHRHGGGAALRVPPGWTATDTPQAVTLSPPGGGGAEELYVVTSHEGFAGPDDPELIRRLRQDLAGTGLLFDRSGERETFIAGGRPVRTLTWELRNPETGVPMVIRFFFAESGGRVLSLVAIAARERALGWDPQLRAVAGTMAFVAGPKAEAPPLPPVAGGPSRPSDGTPASRQWVERLTGKMLTQVSSGAGFHSRKTAI